MQTAIGLPTTIPGVRRREILDWARTADDAGFSSLGTIDRIVYQNHESLVALGAAAAVTERIRLLTAILIAPLRANTALLAKQALTLDALSEGRLTLGLAVGGRQDDFEASGIEMTTRGRAFAAQLDELQRIFAGERRGTAGAIGPAALDGGPELLIGGTAPVAYRRAARFAAGWIAGGGGPDAFAQGAAAAREAWTAEGRDGQPRLAGLAYFSLGDDARGHADRYLRDYYGFLPQQYQDAIAGSALVTADAVRAALAGYRDAGCDELCLFPCSTDVRQVELLADAVR